VSQPYSLGCLWSILGGCGVLIIGGVYLLFASAQPATVSFPIFRHTRTYLEVHIEPHHGGWLEGTSADEYDTVKLYYKRLGGWFENSRRILVSSVKTTGHIQEHAIKFYQQPNDSLALIHIHLSCEDGYELEFKPPIVFPKAKRTGARLSLPY
jgi:hypothetical protein